VVVGGGLRLQLDRPLEAEGGLGSAGVLEEVPASLKPGPPHRGLSNLGEMETAV